ncbi:hypothetical protein BD413DRAFT_507063 [Trametes elegans]|nr:hypothetical protein BD413DRAFT_507063 [Trametes elegans]
MTIQALVNITDFIGGICTPWRQQKQMDKGMYNETLRRNPNSGHEGPAAKTQVLSLSTSAPHPSLIVRHRSLLDLQPFVTVSRSSTRSSPASRRASHRRDAFEGYKGRQKLH